MAHVDWLHCSKTHNKMVHNVMNLPAVKYMLLLLYFWTHDTLLICGLSLYISQFISTTRYIRPVNMWDQVYSRRGKRTNKEQGTSRAATDPKEGGVAAPVS
jgi:hypothetical protein